MRKLLAVALSLSLCSSAFASEALPLTETAPSAPVQASITQTMPAPPALTEEAAKELIRITSRPLPLSSKLKKRYAAYQVTIESAYPSPLRLNYANITNGVIGTMAAQSVHTSKANMWWSALAGLGGVVLIGLPILGCISASNGRAERESLQFSNQIPGEGLGQGESLTFKALTPLGQTPQVSIALKDAKTGLTFTKSGY